MILRFRNRSQENIGQVSTLPNFRLCYLFQGWKKTSFLEKVVRFLGFFKVFLDLSVQIRLDTIFHPERTSYT